MLDRKTQLIDAQLECVRTVVNAHIERGLPKGALIKTQRIIMIFFLHTEKMVNMVNNINVNILIDINFIINMISFHALTWSSSSKE